MALELIQVGIGGRGGHWLDFMSGRPDVRCTACVDVDEAALARASARLGCRTFTQLDEALASVKADAVLVASPSLMHGQHARRALEAGFAVLVEKPLAASLGEAVELVAAARRAGKPVMVAENYRFFQAERTLRKAIEDGLAGRLIGANCIDRRAQAAASQGRWVAAMEQPFLTEIAVHHFDSFRYLFGLRPQAVLAATHNPPGSDYAKNAAAQVLLEMQGGFPIQYSGCFMGSRYEYDLRIEGERGELRTDRVRVWHRKPGERKFAELPGVAMPEGEALRYPQAGMLSMLRQFQAALSGGPAPETSGEDNLWTLAMFEAAVQSAGERRQVAIDGVFTEDMRRLAGIAAGRD